jgi:hypothetical protein
MAERSKPETQPGRDLEERTRRERMMDKTLEDSYPASDPPSSIPDPAEEEDAA